MRNLNRFGRIVRSLITIVFILILVMLIYLGFKISILIIQIPIAIAIIIMCIVIFNSIKLIIFNISEICYDENILISSGAVGKIKINLKKITHYEIKVYGNQMAVCLYSSDIKEVYKNSSFLAWFFIKFSLDNNLGVFPFPMIILGNSYNDFISIIEKNIKIKNHSEIL